MPHLEFENNIASWNFLVDSNGTFKVKKANQVALQINTNGRVGFGAEPLEVLTLSGPISLGGVDGPVEAVQLLALMVSLKPEKIVRGLF